MELKTFQELDAPAQEDVALRIRAAFSDDLRRQGVAPESTATFLRQNFQRHNVMYTMWSESGDFLASASAVKSLDSYFVSNVFVAEEHRGRGLTAAVMRAAEAFCARARQRAAFLWCEKELVPFYEKKHGYVWQESRRVSRERTVEILKKDLAPHLDPSHGSATSP